MDTPRPQIQLNLQPTDKLIEALGLIGMMLLIALPLIYFGNLPETIPSHFGANGKPDAFSSRASIWIMPILGLVIYASLFGLNKFPHIFNYAQPVTPDNVERLYSTTTRLIRFTNCLMAWLFVYITFGIIQVALGKQENLSSIAVLIFCVLVTGGIFYYIYQSRKSTS